MINILSKIVKTSQDNLKNDTKQIIQHSKLNTQH